MSKAPEFALSEAGGVQLQVLTASNPMRDDLIADVQGASDALGTGRSFIFCYDPGEDGS